MEGDNGFGEAGGVGDWLIALELEERVKHRITCDELGYPMCEARYTSVADWEKENGKCWLEFLNL